MSSVLNSIKEFTVDGMWTHRQAMINISLGVPIAIEAIYLCKKIFQNRKAIHTEAVKVKNLITDSFTPRKYEKPEIAKNRILRNAGKVFAATLILGAAAAAPFLVLPTLFAIPYAVAAIATLGKLIANHKAIENKFKHAVKVITNAFTVQPGETPEIAHKRIAKNVIKLTVAVVLVAAITATLIYTIQTGLLASGFASMVQFFQNCPIGQAISSMMNQFGITGWVSFPQPSELMAYALYGLVALGHVVQSIRCYRNGDKGRALYHISGALLSIIFPMVYLLQGQSFRLHHSFYGLIAMLVPFRAFNFFGALMTADSYMYFLTPSRGYTTQQWWGDQLHIYDYSNIFIENIVLFFGVYIALSAFQLLMGRLFKTKKEKSVEIVQPSETAKVLDRPKPRPRILSPHEKIDAELEKLNIRFQFLEKEEKPQKRLYALREEVGLLMNQASLMKNGQRQYCRATALFAEISEKLQEIRLKIAN